MSLSYACCLGQFEARALKKAEAQLKVAFELKPPLKLYDARMVPLGDSTFKAEVTIPGDPALSDGKQPQWQLESVFPFTIFHVSDLRRAYVFLRQIKHAVEDAMILSMPLSPYYGFTQSFNVQFEVPREVANFEQFRRSILLREK